MCLSKVKELVSLLRKKPTFITHSWKDLENGRRLIPGINRGHVWTCARAESARRRKTVSNLQHFVRISPVCSFNDFFVFKKLSRFVPLKCHNFYFVFGKFSEQFCF